MIYSIWFAFVFILIFLYYKKRYHSKIHKNIRFENLIDYLEIFYFQGIRDAIIVIKIMGRDVFVQFQKILIDNNDIRILCFFPIVEWSKKYEEELKILLNREEYQFERKNYNNDNVDFLVIEIGNDFDLVLKFSHLILLELFKFDNNEMISLFVGNVFPEKRIIGNTKDIPSDRFKNLYIPITIQDYYKHKIVIAMKKVINIIFPVVVARQNDVIRKKEESDKSDE